VAHQVLPAINESFTYVISITSNKLTHGNTAEVSAPVNKYISVTDNEFNNARDKCAVVYN